jgi:hypothetical protein
MSFGQAAHASLIRGGEKGLGSSGGTCGWVEWSLRRLELSVTYNLRGWWCWGSVMGYGVWGVGVVVYQPAVCGTRP